MSARLRRPFPGGIRNENETGSRSIPRRDHAVPSRINLV
jgi:hypothetical protein